MANINRHDGYWVRHSTPPDILLHYEEPSWEFRELQYAPGGSFDHVEAKLHVASHLDPIRQRMGSSRNPFLLAQPSAAIADLGERVSGSWEGVGRGRHLLVSTGFVAAAIGKEPGPSSVKRRYFARQREPDHSDAVIGNLMGALAVEIADKNPGGTVFLQTLITSIVHYTLQISTEMPPAFNSERGGLSPTQLRLVLDLIDAQLTGRPSLLELAALLNVSTRYLCRAFRSSTGFSPHQYILRRRVEFARTLIKAGGMSLIEVALAAGFSDHSQMASTFKRLLKVSPSYFLPERKTVK